MPFASWPMGQRWCGRPPRAPSIACHPFPASHAVRPASDHRILNCRVVQSAPAFHAHNLANQVWEHSMLVSTRYPMCELTVSCPPRCQTSCRSAAHQSAEGSSCLQGPGICKPAYEDTAAVDTHLPVPPHQPTPHCTDLKNATCS